MSSADQKNSVDSRGEGRVRMACMLSLVALALIAFSLVVPKPLPVIVAMSVAQGIGTLSLLLFLSVVWRDVWEFMGGKNAAGKTNPESRPTD